MKALTILLAVALLAMAAANAAATAAIDTTNATLVAITSPSTVSPYDQTAQSIPNYAVTVNKQVISFNKDVELITVNITDATANRTSNHTCYFIDGSFNSTASNMSATALSLLVARNVVALHPTEYSFTYKIFKNYDDYKTMSENLATAFKENLSYDPIVYKGCNVNNQTLVGNCSTFMAEIIPLSSGASSVFAPLVALSSVTVAAAMLLL